MKKHLLECILCDKLTLLIIKSSNKYNFIVFISIKIAFFQNHMRLTRQQTLSTLVETTKGIFLTFFDRLKLPKVYLLYHGFKNINRHLLKKL